MVALAPMLQQFVHDDQALTTVIERSTATTMMGLEKELKDAASSLERQACLPLLSWHFHEKW